MSINEDIRKAVVEALSDKVLVPYPAFANRVDTAKLLGISAQTLDRLFKSGGLDTKRHTTQFTGGSNVMYYIPEIMADLAPRGATVMLVGRKG